MVSKIWVSYEQERIGGMMNIFGLDARVDRIDRKVYIIHEL